MTKKTKEAPSKEKKMKKILLENQHAILKKIYNPNIVHEISINK